MTISRCKIPAVYSLLNILYSIQVLFFHKGKSLGQVEKSLNSVCVYGDFSIFWSFFVKKLYFGLLRLNMMFLFTIIADSLVLYMYEHQTIKMMKFV